MQRYQVGQSSDHLCLALGLKKQAVMRAAGLPLSTSQDPRGVTAREYFAFWTAVTETYVGQDVSLKVGTMVDGAAHNSETAAFLLSPDVKTGLERLAVFKPLICPVRARVDTTPAGVSFAVHSADPGAQLPKNFQALHPIFVVSLIRACTGVEVTPLSIGFDGPELGSPRLAGFFGKAPDRQPFVSLTISHEDAALPLKSRNAQKWGWLEPGMRSRLEEMQDGQSLSERVAGALIETLPAGRATIDAVCERLHVGKRTFQRQLQAEGLRFQDILSNTRRDLAMGYLSMAELSVDEIAHLLAYSEVNSFYRAFQTWSGTTPLKARRHSTDFLKRTAGTP